MTKEHENSNNSYNNSSDTDTGSDVDNHEENTYPQTHKPFYNDKGLCFLGYSWWMWIFFPWIVFPILILDLLFEKIVTECYPEYKIKSSTRDDYSDNYHKRNDSCNRRHSHYWDE